MTMRPAPFDLIAGLLEKPDIGWSIGSFGAVGEFVRDPDEPAAVHRAADRVTVVTARGAIRVVASDLSALAWDSLSGDGETWGHALAFCAERPETPPAVVRALGSDTDAIRAEDRDALLFDLGVGCGCVTMAARTRDPTLVAALAAAEGRAFLAAPGLAAAVLGAQPHRVLRSPAGRIEVFQPIPPADGRSPEGPHTHLLPRLIAKDRPHSANTPIPGGWQSALSMHPKSPWRTTLGERHPFDPATDAAFRPLLDRFALDEDREVERDLIAALDGDVFVWPETRRARHKARIILRRLHAAGDDRVGPWRALHDRAPIEIEEGEEA
jgi:hypothetical protein